MATIEFNTAQPDRAEYPARFETTRIREIQLFCAKGKLDFYRKRGFTERPGNAPGMRFRGK